MTGTAATRARPTAPARMLQLAMGWTVGLGLTGLLAASGWLLLFSTFMGWDDEGYVLISLRHFAQLGALYDRVYTQYGPFFFLTLDALHKLLHFEWNSSSGRWIALCCWLASAEVCAALVARRTGSLAASAFALAATFAYLIHDIYEPSHPGSFVALLVAIAALVGAQADIAERPWAAALVGALGAALALTKINVGGFLLIAAATWLLASAAWFRARAAAIAGLCLLLVALPWALMHQVLDEASVRQLAINTSLCVISVMIALRAVPPSITSPRAVRAFFLGAASVCLLTFGLVCARGTSLHGLLWGIVLDPMRHPLVNLIPVVWSPGSSASVCAALLLTWIAYAWPRSALVRHAVAVLRLVAAVLLACVALLAPGEVARFGLSYGVGIAGLCALPLRFDAVGLSDARARTWLSLLLVLQSLHAFPTAASQLSWATFLIVPLLTLAVRDAWLALANERLSLLPLARRLTQGGAVLVVGAAVAIGCGLWQTGSRQYRDGELLGLPGAEDLSLSPAYAWTLRTLAENARLHAGLLFSVRGLYSFNLWSGRPTPTSANATLWFYLLKPKAQREIIARLRGDPRAAVIWESGAVADGELFEYLRRDFERAFALNGLAFFVHRGRHIAPISTAQISLETPRQIGLDLILTRPTEPISQIEVREIGAPGMPLRFRLDASNATLQATPLAETGAPSGPTARLAWPAVLTASITRLRVQFPGQIAVGTNVVALVFSGSQRVAAAQLLQ